MSSNQLLSPHEAPQDNSNGNRGMSSGAFLVGRAVENRPSDGAALIPFGADLAVTQGVTSPSMLERGPASQRVMTPTSGPTVIYDGNKPIIKDDPGAPKVDD